jgi:hypothetical protein
VLPFGYLNLAVVNLTCRWSHPFEVKGLGPLLACGAFGKYGWSVSPMSSGFHPSFHSHVTRRWNEGSSFSCHTCTNF